MPTTTNIAFFPEDAALSIFILRDDFSQNVIRYAAGAETLAIHLDQDGLRALQNAISKHLHEIDEAGRNARIQRAAKPQAQRAYLYRMKYRKVCSAHLPPSLHWNWIERPSSPSAAVAWGASLDLPKSQFSFGTFRTDRELTAAELERWEISPVALDYLSAEALEGLL